MKNIKFFGAMLLTIVFAACAANKNLPATGSIEQAIADKNFVFEAQQVMPRDYRITQVMPNASRLYHLDYGYSVKVTPDSLIVDLPYFGRAYQAPLDPTKGGIKLTSTNFDIRSSKGKKRTTKITITPANDCEVQQMFLEVSTNGYATLSVTSFQREQINFYGIVK